MFADDANLIREVKILDDAILYRKTSKCLEPGPKHLLSSQ